MLEQRTTINEITIYATILDKRGFAVQERAPVDIPRCHSDEIIEVELYGMKSVCLFMLSSLRRSFIVKKKGNSMYSIEHLNLRGGGMPFQSFSNICIVKRV